MTINQAPDIEIYVADVNTEAARQWLETVFDTVQPEKKQKGMPKNANPLSISWQGRTFSAVIFENVTAGYTSIWLDSAQLPWQDDGACGISAAKDLNKTVRISAGGWQQDTGMDDWIEIQPDGTKKEIVWKT